MLLERHIAQNMSFLYCYSCGKDNYTNQDLMDMIAYQTNIWSLKKNHIVLRKNSLDLLPNYLSRRKQKTKISSTFSEWWKIISGISQESILGSLLFNNFINDFFFFILKCDTCNFTDGDTMHSCDKSIRKTLSNLHFWFQKGLNKVNG